jgi:uroporphyrinogen decarboxylase
MGLALDFRENEGPVLETVADLQAVRSLKTSGTFDEFERVAETVANVRKGLSAGKTLIGFCGAPWTVASYMIEGRSSERSLARHHAVEGSPWFEALIAQLVDVSVHYLSMQVAAGAEVLQIFDSWAGDLPIEAQRRWVDKPIAEMLVRLKERHPNIPVIVFARGTGARHAEIASLPHVRAVSVEQDVVLADLLKTLPPNMVVQGNLNPDLLTGDEMEFRRAVETIVASVPMQRHIFNLGHGIHQTTNPDRVTQLLNIIRKHDGTKTHV